MRKAQPEMRNLRRWNGEVYSCNLKRKTSDFGMGMDHGCFKVSIYGKPGEIVGLTGPVDEVKQHFVGF